MLKLAYCQQAYGDSVNWIGEHEPVFQTVNFRQIEYDVGPRFGDLIPAIEKMHPHTDLYHVHTHLTDRDVLEQVLKYAKKPVIWDCHDRPQWIMSNAPQDRLAPVDELKGINGTVYRTYCPKDWFSIPKRGNGKIVISTGLADRPHFRYWLPAFQEMRKAGADVTCYTQSQVSKDYQEAATMKHPLPCRELVQQVSEYSAGLCGSPYPDQNMLSAYPNKLFEYIAAGIPVICVGREHAMAKFIEDNKIGVAIGDPASIMVALDMIEHDNLRANVIAIRDKFSMDTQVDKVTQFYHRQLKVRPSSMRLAHA